MGNERGCGFVELDDCGECIDSGGRLDDVESEVTGVVCQSSNGWNCTFLVMLRVR